MVADLSNGLCVAVHFVAVEAQLGFEIMELSNWASHTSSKRGVETKAKEESKQEESKRKNERRK